MSSFTEETYEAQRKTELAADRAKYVVSLRVVDKDYDGADFDDIGSFTVTQGMLVVFDHEERSIAGYAPGAWMEFHVSREDRLESTDDEPKDDDDSPADQ